MVFECGDILEVNSFKRKLHLAFDGNFRNRIFSFFCFVFVGFGSYFLLHNFFYKNSARWEKKQREQKALYTNEFV